MNRVLCTVRMLFHYANVPNGFPNSDLENFSLEDTHRSGRPTVIETDQQKQIVDQNPQFTTKDIADIVNVSKATVSAQLKKTNIEGTH